MKNFTLEEALRLDSLKGAQLIAGRIEEESLVRYINVMEVPDIADWITEYEILLTTGYPFQHVEMDWKKFIQTLSKKKLAALAIKTDRFMKDIPEELLETAALLNLPIIKLPHDAKFDIIISDVLREIVNQDYKYIKKGLSIHRTFTDLILSGGEYKEVLNALSNILGCESGIVSNDNPNIETTSFDYDEKDRMNVVKKPIRVNEELVGYLIVRTHSKASKEMEEIALERAVDAIAIIYMKKLSESLVERGYVNKYLNELVDGEIKSKKAILERGEYLGFDLGRKYVVMVIDIDSFGRVIEDKFLDNKEKVFGILKNLFQLVFSTFFTTAKDSIVWDRSDSIIILYPIDNLKKDNKDHVKREMLRIARNIKEKIDQHIDDFTVSIGIGTYYDDIMDIHKSYDEAIQARRFGKKIWGENRVYHYDDIGVYNLFVKGNSKESLKNYLERHLGNLLKYEEESDRKLLETLRHLVMNDFNYSKTGDDMFVHPKTIVYRKSRIQEILHVDLDNFDERMTIYVALKIRDIIDQL
ncbi:MAG: PucR family transcriptional regulator ligand-binding domain-containing protein [Gudongella sp.]|nr:PucR family transcriptional regulator ligand-binding domain-containing protein [Gudongella sp.]